MDTHSLQAPFPFLPHRPNHEAPSHGTFLMALHQLHPWHQPSLAPASSFDVQLQTRQGCSTRLDTSRTSSTTPALSPLFFLLYASSLHGSEQEGPEPEEPGPMGQQPFHSSHPHEDTQVTCGSVPNSKELRVISSQKAIVALAQGHPPNQNRMSHLEVIRWLHREAEQLKASKRRCRADG